MIENKKDHTPKRISKVCQQCHITFEVIPARFLAKFCNLACKQLYWKDPKNVDLKEKQRKWAEDGMVSANRKNGGPWNTGLTKETNEIINRIAKNRLGENNPYVKAINNGKVTVWCKGHTKDTHPSLKIISEKNKLNTQKQYQEKRTKKVDTSCEIEFRNILDELEIRYIQTYPLESKLFDFYLIDFNYLIEIDGIYWHGKDKLDSELNETQTKNRKNDLIKNQIAINNGFKLIRFWEDELIIENIKNKLNV